MKRRIPESDLRHLYLEEKLTDAQIGEKLGFSMRQVNYWRKEYGLKSILISDRHEVEPLTALQKQVLVGSMFGDGRLRVSGAETACFTEYHCLEQSAYLRWKADIFGPYVCSIAPKQKIRDGKIYKGEVLTTIASRELQPYWKQFYPSGKGDKTYDCVTDLTHFTPLALAVWFMDDGHRSSSRYMGIATTPHKPSQEAQMALLRERFGLEPKLYAYEYDGGIAKQKISFANRTNLTKFLDLVTPYMHSSMTYKLALDPRSPDYISPHVAPVTPFATKVPGLTKEALHQLYEIELLTDAQIALKFDVSDVLIAQQRKRHGIAKISFTERKLRKQV